MEYKIGDKVKALISHYTEEKKIVGAIGVIFRIPDSDSSYYRINSLTDTDYKVWYLEAIEFKKYGSLNYNYGI